MTDDYNLVSKIYFALLPNDKLTKNRCSTDQNLFMYGVHVTKSGQPYSESN